MWYEDSVKQVEHDTVKIIRGNGYPVEIYDNIQTEDHYFITLFRIPHGKTDTNNFGKPVVLLMHGVLSNSYEFLITGPNRALGFILSELGYDVWLGNYRGSCASRRHAQYNPDEDAQYWNFSFHEIALYDIPAIIGHIKHITHCQSLTYIGYSNGTLLPFVLLSEKPEYNKYFNLIIAAAPVLVLHHTSSVAYMILYGTRRFWLTAMEACKILEFPPKWFKSGISFLSMQIGHNSSWWYPIVTKAIHFLNGRTSEQLVLDDVTRLIKHYPDTTSAILFKHVLQIYQKGVFAKMDYGTTKNHKIYGRPKPPLYNLKNALCPVLLCSFNEDIIARPEDVRTLGLQLPNCVAIHEFGNNFKFNHSDFLYGRSAPEVIYPTIFKYINKYTSLK